MEPVSIALAVTGVINNVALQIMAMKRIHDQIKTADARLMSFISQLTSMKAALAQIYELLQISEYDDQLKVDLELALQASQLHIDYIDSKISKLKSKTATNTLRFRSRVNLIFNSEDMEACLQRLNFQATALNLLITVLTSKSVTEQKAMLQRSNTRKIFKQMREDKASLLDEAASVNVLRDEQSVRNAYLRTKSEPEVTTKNSWKRFAFDTQVLGSKAYAETRAYGERFFGRKESGEVPTIQPGREVDSESVDVDVDDATTLVAESELQANELKPQLSLEINDNAPSKPPRFSKMLAFGPTESDIAGLVSHARRLWNVPADDVPPTLPRRRAQTGQKHRLSTRYFDVSIDAHTLDEYYQRNTSEDMLAHFRDVSSILFVFNLSSYHYDERRLHADLELFAKTVNDYHLWLAKIILFLDTTDLDPYSTHGISEDVKARFMQAGRGGAHGDRINTVVGEADEMAAGTIFAVCNDSERKSENKWAGLTKSPTY